VTTAPLFSIVIPTYNRADAVVQTLNGIFAQTFSDFEVIVVDDGSSDDTQVTLKAITDPRLRTLLQDNAGPAAARNRGMDAAKGQYVAFIDSDDIWYPDHLQQAHTAIEAQGEHIYYSQIIVNRGVGRYWIKPDRPMRPDESIYDYLYIAGGFIQTSTMIVPTRLTKDIRWDENVTFGDNDQFAIDLWHTNVPFHMLPRASTLYADLMSADALSKLPIFAGTSEKYTNFFSWMATRKNLMGQQAWLGFQARFASVALARSQPIASIKLLLQAVRAGAMSPKGMVRQLIQNHCPKIYRKLVDNYVRYRGISLSSLDR